VRREGQQRGAQPKTYGFFVVTGDQAPLLPGPGPGREAVDVGDGEVFKDLPGRGTEFERAEDRLPAPPGRTMSVGPARFLAGAQNGGKRSAPVLEQLGGQGREVPLV